MLHRRVSAKRHLWKLPVVAATPRTSDPGDVEIAWHARTFDVRGRQRFFQRALIGCALRLPSGEPAARRGGVTPAAERGPGSSPRAISRTHSAPARVLPEPRPPSSIHTRQFLLALELVIPAVAFAPLREREEPGPRAT